MIKSLPFGLHNSVAAAVRRCLPGVPVLAVAFAAGLGSPLAGAQQATEAEQVLEEVVVTARFRAENLQETPLAITAITADALESKNLDNVSDLGATIPNAYIRPAHAAYGGTPVIRIRGIGQVESLFAFEPGVGVYIDDVYHATLLGSTFDLMDLEQVEVLRGPQGTLFGKNSLGGAIRLHTKKPSATPEGYVGATYGSRDRVEFKGGFSTPLIDDKLYVRLAGVSKRQDGYQDVYDFRCQMIANGTPQLAGVNDGIGAGGAAVEVGSAADNSFAFPFLNADANSGNCVVGSLGGTKLQAGRVSLLWKASNQLDVNLAVDYTNQDDEPPAISAMAPLGTRQLTPAYIAKLYNAFGITLTPATAANTVGDTRFLFDDPYKSYYAPVDVFTGQRWADRSTMEAWGFAGTADWHHSDALNLKLITGYRRYDSSSAANRFGIPLPLNTVGSNNEHKQKSAELQVYGSAFDKRVDWTVGGFYLEGNSYNSGRVVLDSSGLRFDNDDHFNTKNKSAFLHLVGHATDRLSLTGGLRYTDESKGYLFRHPGNLPANPADPPIPANTSYDRVDWKLGADFKFTDSLFGYAQVATGFRSPGFNPRPFNASQLVKFSEEELTSYEVGLKADWFDHRLRTNVAAFYSDYDKWVLPRQANQCSGNPDVPYYAAAGAPPCPVDQTFLAPWQDFPVGTAKSSGVELEVTASPVVGWNIDATLGYQKLKAGNRSDASRPDYVNPDAILNPKLTASIGTQYRIPVLGGASLTPRLDWSYLSKQAVSAQNIAPGPTDIIPSLSLLNGRVTFENATGDWSLALAVNNITNKFYWLGYVGSVVPTSTEGGRTGLPSEPRQWSLSFQHKF